MLRFSVDASAFTQGVSRASRVVSSTGMQPALSGVLIDGGEQALTLQATDQQMGLKLSVPNAFVEMPGTILLPARQLSELLRRISPGETVKVEEGASVVMLSFGRASFELPMLPKDDFPHLDFESEKAGQQVKSTSLQEILGLVGYAAATRDDSIPVLQGIQLTLGEDGMLSACASDNFRLAFAQRKVSDSSTPEEVVVRARNLIEVLRLINEEEVVMSVAPRRVFFRTQDLQAFAQRIEGAFPDHKSLVREQYPTVVRCDGPSLLAAVERTGLLSAPSAPQVILSIGEEGIGLRASSADLGRGSDFVSAEVSGEGLEIGFNPRFIAEALRTLPGEQARLHLTGPESAVLVRCEEDQTFLALVLPVKIL